MSIPFADLSKEHYVDNAQFSQALFEYAVLLQKDKEANRPLTRMPEYIGECLLKIAYGLASKPNFSHYPFTDEMVSDAVENSIRAVKNYDITVQTRTGKPNAFGYFTQISYYAFFRRIAKEKRQGEIKELLIDNIGAGGSFTESEDSDHYNDNFIAERAKNRYDDFKLDDPKPKKKKKRFEKPVKKEALEEFMT